ncbi:MAG: ribose-phosphate pyrophosphokinase [Acidobacteriota bacterium]
MHHDKSSGEMKIFSGNAHPELAKKICAYLEVPLGKIHVTRFRDGESYCQIEENVRGKDIFAVQPTCPPVNQNLVELLIMIDAFKRASAARITAVIPYFGYARQDRKDKPRVPISAKLVADVITTAGADRILVMDLHAPAIQGFFNIPVDNLYAGPVLIRYLKGLKLKNPVLVSPDAGGTERARAFAKRLNAGLAIMDKRRHEANVAKIMNVIGNVAGKTAVIVDDIVDTAGTLVETVEALKKNGANEIIACMTHAVLSGNAVERLQNENLKKVIVTNTIPLEKEKMGLRKIVSLCIAELFGEAIKRIHTNSSVSSLFK